MAKDNQDDDEQLLSQEIGKDVEIKKGKEQLHIFSYLIIVFVLLSVVMGVIIAVLFADVKNARIEMAQTKQYIYSIMKNEERKNRRTVAIQDISKVIKYYQPKTHEWVVEQSAILIYDIGEVKYNIPFEESIIFFALESRFKRTATSKKWAKGIGQLMEDTAMWACSELKITWQGDITLYDTLINIKLSLFVYKKYRERFNYEFKYYLASYFWGPTTIGKMYNNNEKLKGKYLNYLKDWKKIRIEIENVLDRKIVIVGSEIE